LPLSPASNRRKRSVTFCRAWAPSVVEHSPGLDHAARRASCTRRRSTGARAGSELARAARAELGGSGAGAGDSAGGGGTPGSANDGAGDVAFAIAGGACEGTAVTAAEATLLSPGDERERAAPTRAGGGALVAGRDSRSGVAGRELSPCSAGRDNALSSAASSKLNPIATPAAAEIAHRSLLVDVIRLRA